MARPLGEQVVVITGASSGIGRETAVALARRGAKLVLAARGEAALREAAGEVERAGGQAHAVVTDVAAWDQVHRLAEEGVRRFGRIDTWVNNAGVSAYATFEQMTPEEIDRIIRVDLLGAMYGAKAAAAHMRRQGGGTIINVGSALGERSVPLMSVYCTAKHGLKGFTESLRLELERERSGIRVTLILPASINTPFYRNARSKLGVRPRPYPPVYEPGVVAEAIMHAAEHPRRDIYAGGAGKLLAALERVSPSLVDWYMLQGDRAVRNMLTERPDDGRDNLFAPTEGPGASRGDFGQEAKATSLYTRHVELHPARTVLALAAAAGGVALLWRLVGGGGDHG